MNRNQNARGFSVLENPSQKVTGPSRSRSTPFFVSSRQSICRTSTTAPARPFSPELLHRAPFRRWLLQKVHGVFDPWLTPHGFGLCPPPISAVHGGAPRRGQSPFAPAVGVRLARQMKMPACAVQRHYPRRLARLPFWGCRAVRPRALAVSPGSGSRFTSASPVRCNGLIPKGIGTLQTILK